MNVVSNEDVSAASLLTLHADKIEEYDKQDIVANIELETIVYSIKKYVCHQRMVDFMNTLDLNDQKYETNGNVRDENHNEKFLLTMEDVLSFNIDCLSVYCMSTRFLKDNIN